MNFLSNFDFAGCFAVGLLDTVSFDFFCVEVLEVGAFLAGDFFFAAGVFAAVFLDVEDAAVFAAAAFLGFAVFVGAFLAGAFFATVFLAFDAADFFEAIPRVPSGHCLLNHGLLNQYLLNHSLLHRHR